VFEMTPAAQTVDDFDALLPWNAAEKIRSVNPSP